MAPCTHIQWLRLQQDPNDLTICHSGRLQIIKRTLPDPSNQFPTLITFFGKKSKAYAMKSIFPDNELKGRCNTGIANLALASHTNPDKYPILIADIRQEWNPVSRQTRFNSCHDDTCFSMSTRSGEKNLTKPEELVDYIHCRLLLLFTDVLCIFVEDYGGISGVIAKLTSWATIGSASTLPITVRPRVIVVTSENATELEEQDDFSTVSSIPGFFESFAAVSIVKINRSTPQAFVNLTETISQDSYIARAERKRHRTLFSFSHLAEFFEKALKQFFENPTRSFNFIEASRKANPVNSNFTNHIFHYLDLCLGEKIPSNIPISFVASAIILDGYPPGMHKFNPSDVFRYLYQNSCTVGFEKFNEKQELCSELVCNDIETQVLAMYSSMDHNGYSAATIRQQDLKRHSQYWNLLRSTTSCLVCLQRRPELVQVCGHGLCDMCTQIYGQPVRGKEYHFSLNTCVLCQRAQEFEARLSPSTAHKRMLSLDGGGIKAIISLKLLGALDAELGLPYPLQDNFDYGIGTSSGGLVILAFFLNGWDISTCLSFFRQFARRVFPSKDDVSNSFFARIIRFLMSYFTDGRYDAKSLEETLIEAFGTRPMFDIAKTNPAGMKVAVTATTISNADLCLFTNYNSAGELSKDLGYKHLRTAKAEDEVLTWEAARCTTAAPGYFRTKFLPSLGTFQDGGLGYNNPVRPGMQEGRRIWKGSDFDLVLSIGTGFQDRQISPLATNVQNIFQDGFLARFYRASISSLSLDGQRSWKDHWNGLDAEVQGRHFRLNLPLSTKEPALDSIDDMGCLEDQVKNHLDDIPGLARAFKAASFFFELDHELIRKEGVYTCQGSILSRSPNSRALVQSLQDEFPLAYFTLENGLYLGLLSIQDVCDRCGLYQKSVTFSVSQTSDIANIQIVFNRLLRQSISGFPQKILWFQDQQALVAPFGRPNHTYVERQPMPSECQCRARRWSNLSEEKTVNNKRYNQPNRKMRRSKRRCLKKL